MRKLTVVLALAYGIGVSFAVRVQSAPGDGPRFTNGINLVRPTAYREWVFLSSGLDMAYNPAPGAGPSAASPPAQHVFTNVFVNPSSYRQFVQTGKWKDGTTFVLEARNAGSEASINKAGQFQTGLAGIEAEVKDARLPDGWAYFGFVGTATSAARMSGAAAASCVECHTKSTAVERTFVQFYPTLLEIARQRGTLKPGF